MSSKPRKTANQLKEDKLAPKEKGALASVRAYLGRVKADLTKEAGAEWASVERYQNATKADVVGYSDGAPVSMQVADVTKLASLVAAARSGTGAAQLAIRRLAARTISLGRPLPQGDLRDYVVDLLLDREPKRKKGVTVGPRDEHIAVAVQMVHDMGFDEYRDPGTEAQSACSIVALASDLTEGNVNRIWSEKKKLGRIIGE